MPQISLKDASRHIMPRKIGNLSDVNTDLHLVCKDGLVNSHQAAFSWASGFLRRIFISQLILEDGGKRKEEVTLHFPDFEVKVVKAVTNFLVHGELNIRAGKGFQDDFEQAWEAFRIDRVTFKQVYEEGKFNRKPLANKMVQNSVGLKPGRPVRTTRSATNVPQTPTQVTSQKIKAKYKNPFKTGQNRPTPPGPPGPGAASPVVINPSRKLPQSFLKRNQSLLFKSPKFSSTPIRPFTKTTMNSLPEKLFRNSEVSITLSSEHGKLVDHKNVTGEEDMPIIVEEVEGNQSTLIAPNQELPKGISISKHIVQKAVTNPNTKPATKPIIKKTTLPAYAKKMAVKGHKKLIGGKLKKKDLKRKPFAVENKINDAKKKANKSSNVAKDTLISGRRSSRLSTATFSTYNEEVIENTVFDKKQESKVDKKEASMNKISLTTEEQSKLMNSTKKLTIPLKKLKNDSISKLQGEKSQPEALKYIQTAKKTVISDNRQGSVRVVKTPVNPKPNENPYFHKPQKSLTEKVMPGSNREITVSITRSPAPAPSVTKIDPELEPLTCYICNQTKDKELRILNLKNVFYVRSHISKCLYNVGKLFKAIPPGKDNADSNGIPVDEFGLKNGIWYNCEVEGCWLAQKKGVSGQVCYKVYAIHMASQHGALEMVLMEDGDKARELVEKLMDFEEKKKKGGLIVSKNSSLLIVKTEKSIDVTVEEKSVDKLDESMTKAVVESKAVKVQKQSFTKTPRKVVARKSVPSSANGSAFLGKDGQHNCFLCNGGKDGQGLSFKDLPRLKEHYAKCLYNESKYGEFVPPNDHNSDAVGNPFDEKSVIYRCEIKGCWLQKKGGEKGKVSYKVLAHHMASQHGVLEKILEADSRPFMQDILKGLREVEQSRSGVVGCRFEKCSKLQFKADNKREIKLHYAGTHFSDWFAVNPDTGVPDNFTKSGNRAVCQTCTGSSEKPVYIQGEKEAIRGHLVVKHDMLAEVLIQAGETVKEAREVISDLYPDRLTDVYMDTLDKHTLPLNEDFMSKISL